MTGPGADPRLRWARVIALEIGDLLLSRFRTGVGAERKDKGIVTELDWAAEARILEALEQAFPGDGPPSEQGSRLEPAEGGMRWIVDPLDGTTNYVVGLPTFAVALCCLDADGPLLAVVHAPALGETFTAVRGAGAHGRDRLAVSGTSEIGDAVFLVNKAYHPADELWDLAGSLMGRVRAFRTFGCVSLDLALVAAGRADGVVMLSTDPWDTAAGCLLIEEAGGRVTDLEGDPAHTGARGIVAANPALADQALSLVSTGR